MIIDDYVCDEVATSEQHRGNATGRNLSDTL